MIEKIEILNKNFNLSFDDIKEFETQTSVEKEKKGYKIKRFINKIIIINLLIKKVG